MGKVGQGKKEGSDAERALRKRSVTERLIELVRRQEGVYAVGTDDHMDKIYLTNVWKSVAAIIGKTVPGVTADMVRVRWRSLRDNYRRHKKGKIVKSGSGASTSPGSKWPFMAMLGFLDPFSTDGDTDTNMDNAEESAMDSFVEDKEVEAHSEDIESSQNEDIDSSQAEVFDSSQAEVIDSSQAEVIDSSQAELIDSSQAEVIDSSQAEVIDSSQAEVIDSSQAEEFDSAESVAQPLPMVDENKQSEASQSQRTNREEAERPKARGKKRAKKQQKDTPLDEFEHSLMELATAQRKRMELEPDEIDRFFQSCAIRARRLTERNRALLQAEISNLLYNIEFGPQQRQMPQNQSRSTQQAQHSQAVIPTEWNAVYQFNNAEGVVMQDSEMMGYAMSTL